MKPGVLVAAGGAAWEAAVVAALEQPGSQLSVARRCVDVVDLLAVAASGQGRLALLSATLRRLDADAVDRLHAAEVTPVAVLVRGDEEVEERMRALGIDYVVPEDAAPSVILDVLVQALASPTPVDTRTARMFSDPATSMALPPGSGEPIEPVEPDRRGSVVAVWGPTGSPGRSTVAVALADELARLGAPALLVDADVYGGTVAPALGLLDESPGLAAACRLAAATRLDATALAATCWQLAPRLRVLTGLPIAARWPELRPAAVTSVLDAGRGLADFVVVDCGFCLETDEELSFDTMAPRRNGVTLAVLDAADVVVVVGAADPIGMQRLVRGLAELRDTGLEAPLWVVLNKVRAGAVPGDPATELGAALEQFAGVSAAALLPYDRDAVDGALANGNSLAEHKPNGALRKAVVELAGTLSGRSTATRHRRR